jgi:Holliday junction resolvase RusA-like endonuclease
MKLDQATRKKMGLSYVGSHMRPKLAPAVEGMVAFELDGVPPTTTHHDKDLGWRFGKGGKRIPTIRDSEALKRARGWYEERIKERQELVPIRGPIVAHVVFYWPLPNDPDPAAGEVDGGFCQRKPDRDNAVKALFDVLALRGFLERDEQITAGPITKRWTASNPGVSVTLRTLLGAHDPMQLIPFPADSRAGQVIPVPEAAERRGRWEIAAERIAREYAATNPGPRVKSRRPAGPRAKKVVLPRCRGSPTHEETLTPHLCPGSGAGLKTAPIGKSQ